MCNLYIHVYFTVVPNSIAEQAGLRKGDEVIQVGRDNVQDMTHDEVQDVIHKCGNRIEMVVVRMENKPSTPDPHSPPVTQTSVVLQEEESKGRHHTDSPQTLPTQKKQPPPPPPKPKPPIRGQILQSQLHTVKPPSFYSHFSEQPTITSASCTSQSFTYSDQYSHQVNSRTSAYQQQQQYYHMIQPCSPIIANNESYQWNPVSSIFDYHQQDQETSAPPVPPRFSHSTHQTTITKDQISYVNSTEASVERNYNQSVVNPTSAQKTQSSYQHSSSIPVSVHSFHSTFQQPKPAQPSYNEPITDTQPPTSARIQPDYPKITTFSATTNFTQPAAHAYGSPNYTQQPTTPVNPTVYEKRTKVPISIAKDFTETKGMPPSPTTARVQRNYPGMVHQTSSPEHPQRRHYSSQQIQEPNRPQSQTSMTRMSPSPSASPSLSRRLRTAEGIWPPKDPTSKQLPRLGFPSGWTKESSHGKKTAWPPTKSGESDDESGGQITPTVTPRSGAIAHAWNPRPSTPPCRTPPFAGSPLLGRRNKDIAWPPRFAEKHNIKKPSSKPLRKAHSFEEYVVQHASVTVPPTYRPPPLVERMQPTNT
ncbi:uncharacterized protein LOC143234041 isoform X2 [Tachypleus tridentatus]|uniref:uncharacterized protein LOC143234041 isoform X2 n=1 Tax=Tachypleus tridentatus TaxID=6853 RepID=UPI003FD58EAC